jgi:hypothetical protein
MSVSCNLKFLRLPPPPPSPRPLQVFQPLEIAFHYRDHPIIDSPITQISITNICAIFN